MGFVTAAKRLKNYNTLTHTSLAGTKMHGYSAHTLRLDVGQPLGTKPS